MHVVERFWFCGNLRSTDRNVFRVRSIPRYIWTRVYFIASFPRPGFRTGLFDDAREVPTGNEREFVLQPVADVTGANLPVHRVDRARVDANQHVTVPKLGPGGIFIPQHFWGAVL